MPFFKWSTTAASNGTADPDINWAEGQAPSSVNDSARSMMARLKEWGDDITGAIVTGGTSTAYTVSSNQVFDTLAHLDGAMIAFTPHTTNGATVTLNVDSLGAKPLRSAPSTDLLAGTLIEGTPYVAVYNTTDSAFYLQGFFGNPYNVPLASGLDYWGTSAPNSTFAFAYGQAISRTTYATCFAKMGTAYGSGDGSTTFNLPDKRGRVSAGKDDMGGTAANRLTSSGAVTGTSLGYAGGLESHTLLLDQITQHSHTATTTNADSTFTLTVNGNKRLVDSTSSASTAQAGSSLQGTSGITNTPSVTIPSGGLTLSTTVDNAGSSNPHNNVQPTIIANYIIRIL